ncbi:DUF937 domain-containing protein [Ramlibacter sp. G-1-2-2]|uniref:DUF937 domain-containing protein n=1 Tax=Ramlibacter agri TaxID=2728837 RepID=A0A848GYY9_9BURK|nr:DUF937 domain-containing protein [Ramlibacter agri]NML42519.1 DUF937 domain-containing protein [Ramlibacter agri]
MNITDLLAQSGGLSSIAKELGISQEQAEAGAQALGPAILGAFQQRAAQEGGGGLPDLLSSLGGGGLLDQVLSPQPTDPSAGNEALGQIFGSPDVSRSVAHEAAGNSGLDPELLKKMLPLLAMVVTGFLSKSHAEGAGEGGGGLGGLLGGLLGGAGQSSGQGVLDDVLRMVGKLGR